MAITDPIADMITVIRNANRAKLEKADVRASKLTGSILKILKAEGFIKDYKPMEYKKQGLFRVYLYFDKNKVPAITNLKRVSMPGLRKYAGKGSIPEVYGGLGTAIMSTSKGLLTGKEAREAGVGGEVLLYAW